MGWMSRLLSGNRKDVSQRTPDTAATATRVPEDGGEGSLVTRVKEVPLTFEYEKRGAGVCITNVSGGVTIRFPVVEGGYERRVEGEILNLPGIIDGLPVTAIRTVRLYDRARVVAVTIPDGVATIERSAFERFSGLLDVSIPRSVTTMGGSVFSNCTRLCRAHIEGRIDSIPPFAFAFCSSLSSTNIPDSVTSIEASAYRECTALSTISIPGGVTLIGQMAFAGCRSLTAVSIPASVTQLADDAFQGCDALTEINVAPENPVFASLDGVLFDKAMTTLLKCPGGRPGRYSIPPAVRRLGTRAFQFCRVLEGLEITDGIESIGPDQFEGCFALLDVAVGRNVKTIGHTAFNSCYKLQSVFFRGDAPQSDDDAWVFGDSKNVTVYYAPGTSGWQASYWGRPTAVSDDPPRDAHVT